MRDLNGTPDRASRAWLALALTATVVVLSLAGPAGAQSLYPFDNLEAGPLNGRDGWVIGPVGTAQMQLSTGGGVNPTRIALGSTASSVRNNDANFSFAPFTGTETGAELQFDVMAAGRGGFFALGGDSSGDADAVLSQAGEIGPWLGFNEANVGAGNLRFYLRDAGLGLNHLSGEAPTANAWYRLLLRIDFTANGGNGSGSLFRQNLTAGEITFTPVADLQNIDLNIASNTLADSRPDDWDAMFIHSVTSTQLDNLSIAGGIIPEPSSLALTGAALTSAALRRRRRCRPNGCRPTRLRVA